LLSSRLCMRLWINKSWAHMKVQREVNLMEINEITAEIIDAGLSIHRELGPGLLESVYESILYYELERRGLKVERQVPIPLLWKGMLIKESFRADLIVEQQVIVELKSIEKMMPVHKKQVLTYLRITGLQIGLLLNFGDALFKHGIERIINGKQIGSDLDSEKAEDEELFL